MWIKRNNPFLRTEYQLFDTIYDMAYNINAGLRGNILRSSNRTAAPSEWDPEAQNLYFYSFP